MATVILAVALGRRLGPDRPHALGSVARIVSAGAVTLAVMAVVVAAFDAGSRTASVVTVIVAGAIGAALYAGALRILTGVPLRRLVTIDDG